MFFVRRFDQKFSAQKSAILLMLIAAISFPLMDSMAKQLSYSLPLMQIVWARYTGQFLLILVIFLPRLHSVMKTAQPGLQFARSVALFGGTFFFFTSLKFMDIGQVAAIFQIAPVVITVMAVLFLGERIGVRRSVSLVVGFSGALVIIQPHSLFFNAAEDSFNIVSFTSFLPMCAATCYAGYSVLTRQVKSGESSDTSLFYTAAFGAVLTSLFLPFIWHTPHTWLEITLMMSMSLCGGLGHYCVIQALMRAEASELAPLNYLTMVFAMGFGYAFFGETPSVNTVMGAALIVFSGLYLWRRNRLSEAAS